VPAAILRGQVNYPKAKLFKVSTPSGRDGILFEDFQESFGKDDPTRLVWQLSSEKMNPAGVDLGFIKRMKARLDPVRYARLFEAEFSEDVGVFLPAALIEAATDRGVTVKRPDPQVKYVAAVDASAGGEDAFALAICRLDGERVEQVYGQAWERSASGGIDREQTVDQVCGILERYGTKEVYGDRLTGQWIVESFGRHRVAYKHPTIRRKGRDGKTDHVYVTRSLAYQEV
jgi:hypothetical protein